MNWEEGSQKLQDLFGERRGICALWSCEERHAPLKTVYIKAPFVAWRFEVIYHPDQQSWSLRVYEDRKPMREILIPEGGDVVAWVMGEWRSYENRPIAEER